MKSPVLRLFNPPVLPDDAGEMAPSAAVGDCEVSGVVVMLIPFGSVQNRRSKIGWGKMSVDESCALRRQFLLTALRLAARPRTGYDSGNVFDGDGGMPSVIEAPLQMVESVASLRFPPHADRRMQILMDRNNEGELTQQEREELEALVELSETLALVRSQALHLLGRR